MPEGSLRFRAGLALAMLVLVACAATASMRNPDKSLVYESARPLLALGDSTTRQFALTELDALLANLADDEDEPRPLVVYVHGRGNEPRKSFANNFLVPGKFLSKVERYGVHAIGFNWNSRMQGSWCDRPVGHAAEAAPEFAKLVNSLAVHRRSHAAFWRGRPLVLVAHSMGSYVLIEAAKLGTLPPESVFDRTVIVSSDAHAQTHAQWLGQAAWGADRVVFANPGDLMLRESQRCERRHVAQKDTATELPSLERLGLLTLDNPRPGLLADATYVEVPAGAGHSYFVLSGQRGNSHVCALFDAALHGRPLPLAADWRVQDTQNQYLVPRVRDSRHACFQR